jgi:hypothetical protein
MTKLRNRLLATLVLAAVLLTVLGPGPAMAKGPGGTKSPPGLSSSAPRPGLGPLAGEPDPNQSGAPVPKVTPQAIVGPGTSGWVQQLWITLALKVWAMQHPSKR